MTVHITKSDRLDRRTVLRLSAIAAGGAVLASCSGGGSTESGGGTDSGKVDPALRGSTTEQMPMPKSFKQAPQLADQVKAGDLPPVEERLPAKPYVIPHNWIEPGKYGGTLLTLIPATDDNAQMEYMYGHSLLRWLNDGQDIGPGLVEEWDSNADATEWKLYFREGLKWSDGEPWSTEDIMFWWEDMVLNEEHGEIPPDEARSGTGSLMTLTAPDERTIVMTFDAPAPLTADRLAMWVKRGNPAGSASWMEPKHYMRQFHPKYNKKVGKDWAATEGDFDTKRAWQRNPECPTMTGWRCKTYDDGQTVQFERNPYYWCVSPDGAQLPYMDMLEFQAVKDPEVQKLWATQEGKINFLYCNFSSLFLRDIATLREAHDRTGLSLRLWDAGDGSGSLVFFNQDYHDEKLRELIRNPKFRQALSHAYNRKDVQESIYYNTGELTTGTMSPKAIEFLVNDEGKQVYKAWRDSYIEYDPKLAERMLDEIDVVDKDGDGLREMPDGSKLRLRLDYPADAPREHTDKNGLLRKNWLDIGIDTEINPIPPTSYGDQWEQGKLMTDTKWETGDGPNCLVYPQWMVPIEPTRWAPLQGQFYNVRGTPAEKEQLDIDPFERTPPRMEPESGGPIEKLWELYDQSKVEPNEMKRHQLVWEMIKIHISDGPYLMGVCANTPYMVLVHDDMRNVPEQGNLALGGFCAPWIHPTPAVYDPEVWYWENPEEHA